MTGEVSGGDPKITLDQALEAHQAGRIAEAIALYDRLLAAAPDQARAIQLKGAALFTAGQHEAGVALIRRAIEIEPDVADFHVNLGYALREMGRRGEAVTAYRRALELEPDSSETLAGLATTLWQQGMIAPAIDACRQAIRIDPAAAWGYHAMGAALLQQGRIKEAEAAYRQALEREGDNASLHSDLLFTLNYREGLSPEALAEAHLDWERRHGAPRAPASPQFENERDAERRLRVGYVSPDFWTHSVAYFFEPLLRAHHREAIESFCYADVVRPDAVTERLQGLADHWRPTLGLAEEDLAAAVRDDRIDILVDLTGHTAHNRLPVFARRPAPVQVTWLGYPTATGLAAIDARLTDAIVDPEGAAAVPGRDPALRLPNGFHCYQPPPRTPEVGDLPAEGQGFVTFGSFNHLPKLSDRTIALWTRILERVPDSRLILKTRSFADEATKRRFAARFQQAGIGPRRFELRPWIDSPQDHLRHYGRIDIGLDSLPYNGTTTSCEALWMGVPVVTLRGESHAGRVGASLLTRVGLEALIAENEADYIDKAVALAGDLELLSGLRGSLRERVRNSPLCDAEGFARQVESAYRTLWRGWCDGR